MLKHTNQQAVLNESPKCCHNETLMDTQKRDFLSVLREMGKRA